MILQDFGDTLPKGNIINDSYSFINIILNSILLTFFILLFFLYTGSKSTKVLLVTSFLMSLDLQIYMKVRIETLKQKTCFLVLLGKSF